VAKVVVIGAGPMGLAAAYQALLGGHEVDLVEASHEAGGMAGHFDFGGFSIERFYHFVCRTDVPIFELLQELGIADKLRWKTTTMGFFSGGKLNPWGNPVALLEMPGIRMITKLRYGLFVWVCTHKRKWPELENVSARDWITKWCGADGYVRFWKTLLEYKFYEYAGSISAAWIWTRIKRVGSSRKNIMQEELGYLEGGSKTLIDALVTEIVLKGGRIHLSSPAQHVDVSNNSVLGVRTDTHFFPADHVLSTIPTPKVSRLIPDLPEEWKGRYDAIKNIGICCVVLKLRRSVSQHFWVNIGQTDREIPGVIEFSNLRELGSVIVYVPYYMPVTNEKFQWSDEKLIRDAFGCLTELNPALVSDDLIEATVARLGNAQPICDVGFAAKIPPVQTPIAGLQIADTCFYYPEDRGIAESVRLGRAMACSILPIGDRLTSTVLK
jgi:protoporphyrinogen oxidase